MTIQQTTRDAHHDITWLVGALARALFQRAEDCEAIIPVLEEVADCDFNAPLAPVRPSLAHACRHLPQAAIAALEAAEEVAMALAACLEHLPWRDGEADWAVTDVLGPDGPVRHDSARLCLLVAGPGTTVTLDGEGVLAFVLAGAADITDAAGALRHLRAGMAHPARGDIRSAHSRVPLLAALFLR